MYRVYRHMYRYGRRGRSPSSAVTWLSTNSVALYRCNATRISRNGAVGHSPGPWLTPRKFSSASIFLRHSGQIPWVNRASVRALRYASIWLQ